MPLYVNATFKLKLEHLNFILPAAHSNGSGKLRYKW
jgi:hypothetical protein